MQSIRNWAAVLVTVIATASWMPAQSKVSTQSWVGSWATSQQLPEPQNSLPAEDLNDATLRQIVHLSVAGSRLRVHVSNAFGFLPLRLSSVHIARPLSTAAPAIDPASDKALAFSGKEDVVIPPGAEYLSDPIDYPAAALSDLAVSMHFDLPPAEQTGHRALPLTWCMEMLFQPPIFPVRGSLTIGTSSPRSTWPGRRMQPQLPSSETRLRTATAQPPTATTDGPTCSQKGCSPLRRLGISAF
jgi:hypothetical protein